MGIFDFFNKNKKERERQEQLRQQQEAEAKRKAEEQRKQAETLHREEERKRQMQTASSTATCLFSKTELENLIQILSRISYIFQKSDRLIGGRNEKMMSRTHSYAGILGYFYEKEYHYGKMADIVDSRIASHYLLVEQAMQNAEHRKRTIKELADNWSDVLQVIYNLQLDSNLAGDKFKTMEADIQKVSEAFEKLSGSKCKKPKNQLEEAILSNFDFNSNCHQRYEGGNAVMGLQVCPRYLKIRKNVNGCSGYQLKPGDGYILSATNGDTGKPQFAPKPMRVVKFTDNEILLKGYTVSAQTPFGWQEVDLSDYGFSIWLKNGKPERCELHMYDRNVKLEYLNKPQGQEDDRYSRMVKNATFNPFNITCDPNLENKNEMPDFRAVFTNELTNTYNRLVAFNEANNRETLTSMITGYTFNLVESYYKNAGYVPKNTLDKILEQVYDAIQQTGFRVLNWTLDDFKYNCYYGYLNK